MKTRPRRRLTSKHLGRVLIADDSIGFRNSLGKLFQDQGFQVRCTGAVHGSLNAVCQGRYDIIILDMRMPEEEGGEVSRIKLDCCAMS